MKNTLLTLALIASAAVTAPSYAAEPGMVSSTVHTADLDLRSRDGQRELDRRIVRAAREVCGTASEADLEGRNAVRQCRAVTVAAAASRRDQLLAAAKSGSPIQIASAR